MARILVVDDDRGLRRAMLTALADLGHEGREAADGAAALTALAAERADAVLLDLRMPGMDGMEVLRRIRALPAPPPVAVITAVPDGENTIEAIRLGAADHLAKPVGREGLRALLGRMLGRAGEAAEDAAPATRVAQTGAVLGSSPAMREVQKAIGLLADGDVTVLLQGETGVGKEVVARAIHRHGVRGSRPFVAVNCAAIPGELLESLLFGHVRGAFTGAVADRAGSFREAEGGTIFLDEIGDMDAAMQAKLLRVLQERVVAPVGGRPVPVDVRVIAATHRDLPGLVRAGTFRADLFWRIGVVPLRLPPLRERPEDILPLAAHFLRAEGGGGPRAFSPDAEALLRRHAWPGNVRELGNAVKRVAALVRRPTVEAGDLAFLAAAAGLAPDAAEEAREGETLPEAVERLERAMIGRALRESGGNRARAADRLGIRRQLLYGKLARYGMSDPGTEGVPDGDGTDAEL